MKIANIVLGLIAISTIAGCAQPLRQPANIDNLANLPAPKTQKDQNKTCALLRSEIARLQSIADSAMDPAMYPFKTRVKARTAVSDLESKATEFGCDFMMSRNKFDH